MINNDTKILYHDPYGLKAPTFINIDIPIPFYGLAPALGVYPVFPFKNLNGTVTIRITFNKEALKIIH